MFWFIRESVIALDEFVKCYFIKYDYMKKLNYWCFIILAFLFGFFGLQEFYRGNVGLGILAVLFCWTFIPAIVATVEGLVWLFKGPDEFNLKYNYEA